MKIEKGIFQFLGRLIFFTYQGTNIKQRRLLDCSPNLNTVIKVLEMHCIKNIFIKENFELSRG